MKTQWGNYSCRTGKKGMRMWERLITWGNFTVLLRKDCSKGNNDVYKVTHSRVKKKKDGETIVISV